MKKSILFPHGMVPRLYKCYNYAVNLYYTWSISIGIIIKYKCLLWCHIAVDCGALEAPANGHVDTSQGTVFMNTAVYSCAPGYNLTGCSVSECLATGSWSCDPPFCAGELQLGFCI